MKKDKYFGFTLAEVIAAILVLGILAAILIHVITKVLPNKSKTMFQKAYYTTEKVTKELITNEGLYPSNKVLIGFMNTTSVTYNGNTYNTPTTKFAQLFASVLNISGTPNWNNEYNFTTNDGIVWSLPQTEFTKGGAVRIHVDVIGGTQNTNSRKNPNCTYDATTCPNPDQFNIYVYNDGQMLVTGVKEVEYLEGIPTDPQVGCVNHWDDALDTCKCTAGTQCDCPTNNIWEGSGCRECQDGDQCFCASPQTFHKISKQCCTAGTKCDCTQFEQWNGNACQACTKGSTCNCTGGQTYDGGSYCCTAGTRCSCGEFEQWNGNACQTCAKGSTCNCTGGQTYDGGSYCCSANTTCSCTGGKYWNGADCVNCSGGRTWNGSSCACTSGNWNGSTCVVCTGSQSWDTATLTCKDTCASGTSWSTLYNKCCNTSTPSNCCSKGYVWSISSSKCEDICQFEIDKCKNGSDQCCTGAYTCRCSTMFEGNACIYDYDNYFNGIIVVTHCGRPKFCVPKSGGSCPMNVTYDQANPTGTTYMYPADEYINNNFR